MKKPLSNWKKNRIKKLFKEGLSISGITSTVKVSKYSIYKTMGDSIPHRKVHHEPDVYPKHLKERFEREAETLAKE